MTEMQKQFEEWAKKEGLHVNFISCDCFYDVRATETAWQAWQASRAAIVVKLPEFYLDGDDAFDYCEGVENALDEAGVSYE